MKAHFIGIAGKGMSATALLLRQKGWTITGSDEGFYPPVSTYLEHAGIAFHNGYKKEHIPADADIIVIGKNAKLVPETNEEVRSAFASGARVSSFPDVLEELTQDKDSIVVAGSYGKSTTTALLAWSLKEAGKDPSYFIGEIVRGFEEHARLGAGNVFVLEGDEYPSSNWDEASKFLHYNAKNVLLTSATHDHINVYPTHESYLATFKKLISSLPADGLVVANGSEPYARSLAETYAGRVVLYSLDDASAWHASNIAYGARTTFDLMKGAERIASLSTALLGSHNIENIVGAGAMLLEKNLLTPAEFAKGVASFQGVKRRMELLSQASSIPVLEGFGSSYEKTRSAMRAMQQHYAGRRLLVVFEPNTIGWRSRASLPQYDSVFSGADRVYIVKPPHDGKETQLSAEEISSRVSQAGISSAVFNDAHQALALLQEELRENDAVLLSSSGAMDGLIESIPALAEKKFPVR